jgi:uncharacterized membrane protein
MTKIHKTQKQGLNKTAQRLKQRLIFLISLLSISVTILILRVAENSWPLWIAEYRSRIIGILLLVLVVVLLSSPLIIQSSQQPREFPGPGKNPYIDP